jgi:hypothetical protein
MPLYSQPGCTCFFNEVTRQTNQLVTTLISVRLRALNSLTRPAMVVTNDISDAVGSSTQVLLYSERWPTKGGRQGLWFSQ